MNLFQILDAIEKVDPEVYGRLDSRRAVFKNLGGLGQRLTAATLPLALGAVFTKAYAQSGTAPSVVDVLNVALRLEYLESTFYNLALGTIGVAATSTQTDFRSTTNFNSNNLASLDIIRRDEANHVSALLGAIRQLNGTPVPAPSATANALGVTADFDFTGGQGSGNGPFRGVFTTPATFLSVAQVLEDTGVRAYKGGAPYLMSNKDILTTALNIHSVEARHASRLRTIRRAGPLAYLASGVAPANLGKNEADRSASPKSWISGQDNGGPLPAVTSAVYGAGSNNGAGPGYTLPGLSFPAESNATQASINLATNTTVAGVPTLAFSEAFDEALDLTQALAVAKTFATATSTFFN